MEALRASPKLTDEEHHTRRWQCQAAGFYVEEASLRVTPNGPTEPRYFVRHLDLFVAECTATGRIVHHAWSWQAWHAAWTLMQRQATGEPAAMPDPANALPPR